jgi:hypothetical protein
VNFSDLLKAKGIDPKQVLILRHRPSAPALNALLPTLALERPDVFNAYQQTQVPRTEAAMKKAAYVASFIGMNAREGLFVGLYKVGVRRPLSEKEFWSIRAHQDMKPFGLAGFTATPHRQTILWFDLKLTDLYANWKGKLIIDWPPPERSWFRWANRGEFQVKSILPESALATAVPPWDEIVLSYDALKNLPNSWKAVLANWRGIYLIVDTSDRKPYVGAAYGADNIYGRWMNYARGKNGGNKLMQGRDPKNFRFSILQRPSPDITVDEIVVIENKWKQRLHTRHPHGLNGN